MIEIGRTLVSFDVLREHFCCNLDACKGACCVHGDAGAPLTIEEAADLEDYQDELSPYMSSEGLLAVMELGSWVRDTDGEIVTPLVNNRECAYTRFVNGIATCTVEKAWQDMAVPFHKPLSCHLYPVRIKSYESYDAVNYDIWDICQAARLEGDKLGLPVYRFVGEALVRKYGQEWYDQLEYAGKNLDINKLK